MSRFQTVFLFLLLLAPSAFAGIGELNVTYGMNHAGPERVCLMVVPDGSGPGLDEALAQWGVSVDATIWLEFLDALDNPVANFPAEDMWLVSADEGLVACPGGTIADGPTDAQGMAYFALPLEAGGWSADVTLLVVNGQVVPSSAGLDLVFNSPDINGDLEVNLSDVQLFAGDFYGTYHHRSDLSYDGTINLSDIVPLANSMGTACP